MSDRAPLRAVQVAIAATIVGFASGSSSVRWVIEQTRGGVRWGALLVLCALSVAWALRRGIELRPRPPVAAAAAFAALAALSTAWSVDAGLTFGRAGSLGILVLTGAALAQAVRGRADEVGGLLYAVLAGAVVVALASLATLALTRSNAVQPATLAYGARFQGFAQNPNTLGMLLALALPIGVWALLRARTARGRALAGAAVALLAGELAATGSRGSLVAALTGVLVVAGLDRRPARVRLALVAGSAALFVLGLGAARLAEPSDEPPPGVAHRLLRDAELRRPLEAEVGLPRAGAAAEERSLFSSSGRFAAWEGAIEQGNERPVAGYGFGTEREVFVDRYFGLDSDLAENSYVGLYLQLGLAGLLAFAVFLAACVRAAWRPARVAPPAAALLAVVLAGAVLALGQSFVYSVGATGTLPFWLCALLTSAIRPKAA